MTRPPAPPKHARDCTVSNDALGCNCKPQRTAGSTPAAPKGCGECQGWPGHHPGCSKYGIPRTEAGARLLNVLENLIYRGGTIGDVARIDIVSIEDEAEVRAANRSAIRSTPAAPQPTGDPRPAPDVALDNSPHTSCPFCGTPGKYITTDEGTSYFRPTETLTEKIDREFR